MDNNFYNIAERIEYIAKHENVSIRSIEVIIGTSNGVLNKIVKNKGDLKCSVAAKLLEKFPQYSAEWFVCGIGEPLKKDHQEPGVTAPVLSILYERIDQQKMENAKLNDMIDRYLKTFYQEHAKLPGVAEPDQEYSNKNK